MGYKKLIIVLFVIGLCLSLNTVSATSTYTASTETHCDDNGKCWTALYSGTMNYHNGSDYVPINTTVKSSSDPKYSLEMTDGLYSAFFESDPARVRASYAASISVPSRSRSR